MIVYKVCILVNGKYRSYAHSTLGVNSKVYEIGTKVNGVNGPLFAHKTLGYIVDCPWYRQLTILKCDAVISNSKVTAIPDPSFFNFLNDYDIIKFWKNPNRFFESHFDIAIIKEKYQIILCKSLTPISVVNR